MMKKAVEPGALTICPGCGEESFIKLQAVMDGWEKTGEVMVCSLCGHEFGKYTPPAEKTDKTADKTAALAALLGGVTVERVKLTVDDDEKRFCRDCIHCVEHPFELHCTKHDKSVGAMDDCTFFERKTE
jgi:hypothetical protein